MSNIFDYELIDIDLKENFSMQMDTECHQNDKLVLHFIIRNLGELVDLTNYSVELRVKKSDGTDYIQTEEFITKGTNGELTITCKDVLTNVSGIAKGQLRIWNSTYDQASGRILNINIIKDVLEVDRSLHESTLTQLEHLDKSINVASDYIKEADKIKNKLEQDIATGNSVDSKLKDTTQTANNTNNTLNAINTTATTTKNELNTLNNNAINTKSNLDKSNAVALVTNKTLSDTNTGANNTNNTLKSTISDADKSKANLDASKINADKSKIALDTSKSNADKSKSDLDNSISTGATLKNDIDNRLTTGNKLKTDLNNSSTVATTKKEQLDGANIQAEKNIETLNSFGDASQLTKDVTTLKTKVLENTLTSIETDSTLTKLDNCENGFVRNMQLKGRTLQNLWNNENVVSLKNDAMLIQTISTDDFRTNMLK
ncbi:hypothetical protein FDB66_15785, partial [Clostridium botulinum]|nr:hypothetical protein [Clostridium botulinum]NFL66523.1 hypothetical protein [Clostridium botulinum]NFN09529.1 hypothetical protein [Clostridium botulinum]NFN26160.1 hypothetical protein [Clostridium botulinum]NFN33091.1 hypothetical protein [Clostridium botulinum]